MTKNLVLGLGGTVDYELEITPAALDHLARSLKVEPRDLDRTIPITDERTWLRTYLAFIATSTGGERALESRDLADQISAHFPFKTTLGGTGVRAALALSRLGVPSTVHLVSIDDNVRTSLPDNVSYVCSADHDSLNPHLICQYPAGISITLKGQTIVSRYPNRVIYVNDQPNRDMILSPELGRVLSSADVFLICGFNVMRDPDALRDRLATLDDAMTHLSAAALVYYEDAGFHDNAMRQIITNRLPGRIDIHGMNEDELQTYLGRAVDLTDPDDIAAALDDIRPYMLAPTLVLHTNHWALARGPRAEECRPALHCGIDLASTRYLHGDDMTLGNLSLTRRLPRQTIGQNVAVHINRHSNTVCIPCRQLETATPTTIGLGDTFVGGFLGHDAIPGAPC